MEMMGSNLNNTMQVSSLPQDGWMQVGAAVARAIDKHPAALLIIPVLMFAPGIIAAVKGNNVTTKYGNFSQTVTAS